MIASLALQKALRAALVASAPLIAVVPASAIVDGVLPARFPSIIIGEGIEEAVDDIRLAGDITDVETSLHIWMASTDLAGVKEIAALVQAALATLGPIDGFHAVLFSIRSARFLRDPGGEHAHGVLTIAARLEVSP